MQPQWRIRPRRRTPLPSRIRRLRLTLQSRRTRPCRRTRQPSPVRRLRLTLQSSRTRPPRRRIRQLSNGAKQSKLKHRGQPRLSRHLGRRRSPQNMLRSTQRTMSTIDHDRTLHRFTAMVDNHRGVLDYTLAGNIMAITHTHVPEAIARRGVAAELMGAAVSAARANGWTIDPVCSYAVDYLRRHPMDPAKEHIEDLLDEALEESFPASDSPSVGGSS
jgi:predicted GNAT family acetyltransferase